MNKKVIIYTTPTCPYCLMLKKFLQDNKIDFENIDVSSNRQAAEEMIKKSAQTGVPVIDIDGEIVVGFNKEKIKQLLGL